MKVFVVQHERLIDDKTSEVKFIGVFSKKENAERVVNDLSQKPGFSTYVDGFSIGEYELDAVWWNEGFVIHSQT